MFARVCANLRNSCINHVVRTACDFFFCGRRAQIRGLATHARRICTTLLLCDVKFGRMDVDVHKYTDATYVASCTIWLQAAYLLVLRVHVAVTVHIAARVCTISVWMYRLPYKILAIGTVSLAGL